MMNQIDTATTTVLLVEDDMLVREVLLMELEDAGFKMLAASNCTQALALLASDVTIDVMFTDISLRDTIDGWELALRGRALRPELHVIYATGYAEQAPNVVPGGRFFKKPFICAQIIEAVREMTGGDPPG
jgi:DNA-binding NtrC family response regulator